MKTDFKYPILSAFFDADRVACVFVDELTKTFPHIDKLSINYKVGTGEQPNGFIQGERYFDSFSWDISTKDGARVEIVMASHDAQLFVDLYHRILEKCKEDNFEIEDDYHLSGLMGDSCLCSVCNELLFPDDEVYSDEDTGETLCDGHSITNEETGNYKKSVD